MVDIARGFRLSRKWNANDMLLRKMQASERYKRVPLSLLLLRSRDPLPPVRVLTTSQSTQ